MMFGPKRNHILMIFETVLKDYGLLILLLGVCIYLGDFSLLYNRVYLLMLAVIQPIVRLRNYISISYMVKDGKLIVQNKFIVKKTKEIDIKNITNVDITQTFLFQIFKVNKIIVDTTASIGGAKNKIEMVFNDKDTATLKALLVKGEKTEAVEETDLHSQQGVNSKSVRIKYAKPTDIVLLGLLKLNFIALIQIVSFIGAATPIITSIFMGKEIDVNSVAYDYISNINQYAIFAVIVFVVVFIGIVASLVKNFITYYNFRISDNGDSYFIEYGLITRKTHTLVKEKISGITYKRPPLMKIFKLGYLEVSAIGYGGDDDKEASADSMFFPLIKNSEFEGFIGKWLPEMDDIPEVKKNDKKTLFYFFFAVRFYIAIIITIIAIILKYTKEIPNTYMNIIFILIGIISLAIVITIVLEARKSGIGISKNILVIENAGIETELNLLYVDKIEHLANTGTIRKRKKGFVNLRVGMFSSQLESTQLIRNIRETYFEDLKNVLKY